MSSDIQTTLESLVLNNYVFLIMVTAVIYDYILTFSREIEYVWLRPWTWVSTMFVLVRYIGLCWIATTALGGTFVPGPLEVSIVIYQIPNWTYIVFLSATDLVMILRVYAMWNRSRMILSILLFLLVTQTIVFVVFSGIYYDSDTHFSVTIGKVSKFSFCMASYINIPATFMYRVAPQLVLATTLVTFAVSQTLKQSFEMYKATKQWQPNRYMQKLVGDGILYFMVNVLYQIIGVLGTQNLYTSLFLFISLTVTFYTLIPRFIIGIRELHDRDIRGHFHIDTGFGMQLRSNAGPDTTVSAVVFMDGQQGPEAEGDMGNSGDLELGRVPGSGLNEDSIGGGE